MAYPVDAIVGPIDILKLPAAGSDEDLLPLALPTHNSAPWYGKRIFVRALAKAENELWVEYEKKGYDSWIELWCLEGCSPRAGACPARYLKADSIERRAFIRGWSKADKEHKGE